MLAKEELCQALNILYSSNPDPVQVQKVDAWLKDFQHNRMDAWQVVDELLSTPNLPEYIYIFSAQTLHHKIRHSFQDLPSNSLDSLRNALFVHMSNFNQTSKVVRLHLGLAIAALALRMDAWTNIIADLISKYGQNPVSRICLLEILTVLPEECYNDVVMTISEERHYVVRMELEAATGTVLQLLIEFMQTASNPRNSTMQLMVFKCLQSWILDCNISPDLIATNPLILSLTEAMGDPELFDQAVDTLVGIFRTYDRIEHHLNIIQVFVPKVISCKDAFFVAAREEDTDACLGYCRIFTEMSESYLDLILSDTEMNQHEIFDVLLSCLAYSDTDVANITLNFWYRFTGALTHLQKNSSGERMIQKYSNCLTKLSTLCIQTLQFPEEYHTWVEDKQQDFKTFRQEVGDILRDCCQLQGAESVFNQSIEGMKRALDHSIATNDATGSWKYIEACLYTARSIARCIGTSSESQALPYLFQLLPRLPHHPAVQYTATLVINRYSSWLRRHQEYVPSMFDIAHRNLQYQDPNWQVRSAAVIALRSMSIDCPQLVGPKLIELYHKISSGGEVPMIQLSIEDHIMILEGICSVISAAGMNHSFSQTTLRTIAQPICAFFSTTSKTTAANLVMMNLRKLMCLFEFIQFKEQSPSQPEPSLSVSNPPQHPLIALASALWEHLIQVQILFASNEDVIENVCRCYKRLIRTTRCEFKPMVPQLCTMIQGLYHMNPKSSYLYCTSVVITEYGTKINEIPEMIALVNHLAMDVFKLLNSKENITEYPDMIEEFFFLIDRTIKYSPSILFLTSELFLSSILQLASAAMYINHHGAYRSIQRCLEKLIQSSSDPSLIQMKGRILDQLLVLVQSLVKELLECYSIRRIDDDHSSVSSVMLQLLGLDREKFQMALVSVLNTYPAGKIVNQDVFLTELSTAQNSEEFRRALRLFSRSNHHTQK